MDSRVTRASACRCIVRSPGAKRDRGRRDVELAAWPVLEAGIFPRTLATTRMRGRRQDPASRARPPGTSGNPMKMVFTPNSDTWGWAHRYRALSWHGHSDRRALHAAFAGSASAARSPARTACRARARLRTRQLTGRYAYSGISGRRSSPGRHRRFSTWRVACAERGITRPFTQFARVGGEQLFQFQRAEIERLPQHSRD